METQPAAQTGTSQAEQEQKPANGEAAQAPASLAEWQDRFLRLAADFANYKRRNEAERAEIADWARRDFALALLPILDDFGLMVEYETQHPEQLAEGAKLIRQKITELLAKQGLEKIEALHQPYDYERHEAVLTQPVTDPALDQVVLSVMQDGYMFKGRVLRPSKVIVGQHHEKEEGVTTPSSSSSAGSSEENRTEQN
ncbi:MAG: nucleotide exchange factor GrpE [candidate division KSB1 bacterium]|nr:nucleotide exchange factor GrpE [candidate division KSB1 bacterium]MDZ7368852.1 nucleotide exchange factor GrpE [candidate division KSB1 bacterium]